MKVFIIEDDPFYANMLAYQVNQNPDNTSMTFNSGMDFLKYKDTVPDVITMDYSLPDYDGIELLKELNKTYPDVPKVVISSQQEVENVLKLFELGVTEYLLKDNDTKNRLWSILNHIKQNRELTKEVQYLKKKITHIEQGISDFEIIGQSNSMKRVFKLMEKACSSSISVSIHGETGTGKEVVAKSIHKNSARSSNKFVAVNMAAVPENLIESELFGHEKGSFTGATMRRQGKFEEANGGTIFLDEIAELNLNMQAKLLRVLQESEVTPVGSNKEIKLDLRVIVATHRNIGRLVQEGKFREDLFYRLMGLQITLPPLCERGDDILLLSEFFLDNYVEKNGLPEKRFSEEAKEKLLSYNYPGNVRELRSMVELCAVMSESALITKDEIKFFGLESEQAQTLREKPLKEHCNDIIKYFLDKYDNNVIKVSQILEISKSKIYQMIKEGEL